MRPRAVLGFAGACALTAIVFATSKPPSPSSAELAPPRAETPRLQPEQLAPRADEDAANARPANTETAPCPEDMVFVDTTFCPDVARRCIDMEAERSNHLSICHAFAPEQACRAQEKRIAFCIDRYEYPNQRDAHPTWMLDWYQAQATCESKEKRLCWASEWTA